MNTPVAVCLDSQGNAMIPDGYEIVGSETRFLAAALQGAPIAVRGEAICRWAETFFVGRGIRVRYLRSPNEDLLAICPGLNSEDAERILDIAGSAWRSPEAQPTLLDILAMVYPDGPWHAASSSMHAAGWLLWLDSHEILGYTTSLLSSQAALWHSAYSGPERQAYELTTSDAAAALIRKWLRLDTSASTDLGVFPVAIPEKWIEAARKRWSFEVIRRDGQLFEGLRNQALPRRLMQLAAEITSDYFLAHPEKLTVRKIRVLEDYLDSGVATRLYQVVPPRSPSDVPESVPALLDWFEDEYLPYRVWESINGDDPAHERVSTLARAFADWYLQFYPSALSGSEGKGCLSITKSAALLADTEQSVILWVVLDGLHEQDARELNRLIQQRCPRLHRSETELVFAPVPTITEFAKPALLSGLPPALAAELHQQDIPPGFRRISEGKDPSTQLRSAHPGDRFVWILSEPDKTYHKPNDGSTTKILVSAQLSAIAERIASVVSATPDALNLRMVLSTDHGRIMGRGSRLHPIPNGCSGRGRAAWGSLGVEFPNAGYVISGQNQLAYLSRGRFGLRDDCAVVLSEDAFVKSDGKGGQEEFSHGGIYPEEVIVPWVEFCRDVVAPSIRVYIRGRAKARTTDKLEITVENPSHQQVILESIRISIGTAREEELPIDHVAPQMEPTSVSLAFGPWPTQLEIAETRAVVRSRLANGLKFETEAQVQISSEEMYARSRILEDL